MFDTLPLTISTIVSDFWQQETASTHSALLTAVYKPKPLFLKAPSTVEEWKNVASEFWELWQFPNCIGASDGKHIQITAPQASGSEFFNYKKTFSIILLAVWDASYNFTIIVDIGAEGSQNDGGVFASAELGLQL